MEKIQIKIQYSTEDLRKSYKLHNKNIETFKNKILLFLGIIIILAGVIITFINLDSSKPIWMGLIFVGAGIYVVIRYVLTLKKLEKDALTEMQEFHSHPFTFKITDKGIDIKGKNINSKTRWSNYVKSTITDDVILLYPNSEGFTIFPRAHFSPSEFYQLVKWIKENVRKK